MRPTIDSTTSPPLKSSSVGIERTPNCIAVFGLSSTFSFSDGDLTVVVSRQRLNRRRNHSARAAPFCPEIDQDWDRRLDHRVVEIAVGEGSCVL